MPAPTGATITTAAGLLMEMYPDKVTHDILNTAAPAQARLRRVGRAVEQGRRMGFSVRTGLPESGADRAELDISPPPGNVTNQWAYFQFAFRRQPLRVTVESMEIGGAIRDILTSEVEGVMDETAIDLDQNLFLSKRGERATVTANGASDANTIEVSTVQYLRVGMPIDVVLLATGLDGAVGITGARIVTIVPDNPFTGIGTITIDLDLKAFASLGTTYGIFKAGEWGIKQYSLEDVIRATDPTAGAYGGIARATTPAWAGTVMALGAVIDWRALPSLRDQIYLNSGKRITEYWAHQWVVSDLIELAKWQARAGMKEKELEMWGNSVTVDGTPVYPMLHVPYGTVYALNMNTLQVVHPKGKPANGRWIKSGGDSGTMMQYDIEQNVLNAQYFLARELVCLDPRANGKLTGVTFAPTGSVTPGA